MFSLLSTTFLLRDLLIVSFLGSLMLLFPSGENHQEDHEKTQLASMERMDDGKLFMPGDMISLTGVHGIQEDSILAEGRLPLFLDVFNQDTASIDSLQIYLKVNKRAAVSYTWNTALAPQQPHRLLLDSLDFLPDSVYSLKLWVDALPGDSVQGNDTFSIGQFFINPSIAHHALQLDGSDDYAEVGSLFSLSALGDFTASAWIYVSPTNPHGRNFILDTRGDGSVVESAFWLDIDNDLNNHSKLRHGVSLAPNPLTYVEFSYDVGDIRGTWHHTALMRSGSTFSIFWDGKLVSSSPVKYGNTSNNAPLDLTNGARIGTYSNSDVNTIPNYYFNGKIDEVQIWERALSINELRKWMVKADSVEFEPGLVSAWHFAAEINNTTFDYGSQYHANLQNGASISSSSAPIADGLQLGAPEVQLESLTGISENAIINEGKQLLQLNLKNTGSKAADSLRIYWSHNNALPDSLSWNDTLAIGGASISIDLDSLDLLPEIIHELRVWVGAVAGDTIQQNDTLKLAQFFVNPAAAHHAINLSRSYDFLNIPNAPSLDINGNQITLEGWVYHIGGSNWARIFVKQVKNNSSPYILYGLTKLNNTSRLEFSAANTAINGRVFTAQTVTSLPVNTWTHVAAVYDGTQSDVQVYFNGIAQPLTTSGPVSGNIGTNDRPLVLGRNTERNNENYNGIIDEFRLWNTSRSQAEIREWMVKADSVEFEPGLVSVYHFANSNNNLTLDYVNQNHGTLYNGASIDVSGAPIGDGIQLGVLKFSWKALWVFRRMQS
jgi:hypothetical protein